MVKGWIGTGDGGMMSTQRRSVRLRVYIAAGAATGVDAVSGPGGWMVTALAAFASKQGGDGAKTGYDCRDPADGRRGLAPIVASGGAGELSHFLGSRGGSTILLLLSSSGSYHP